MSKILKNISTPLTMVLLSYILGSLIVENNFRLLTIFFLLPILLYTTITASSKQLIQFILVATFVPIKINVTSTDLGSISQYLYFCGFILCYLKAHFLGKKIYFNTKLLPILLPLICIGAISTLSLLPNILLFRSSFWALFLTISLIAFLLLLDSMEFNNDQERTSAVTHLLDLIVLCTCIQILFGILVYYFPYTGNWFKFFYNVAGDTGLQSEINSDNIVRLRTFSLPAEAVGEFSAMLIPYALYRLTSSNNPPYILGTHILLIGVILSGTRSGAVLSLIGIILFYTFVEKNIRIKLSHISYAIVIFSILIIFNIGSTGIITRFGYAYNAYISGSDIGTILNRKFLFEGNWIFFKKTLSLFGNGLISPVSAGFLQLDFHNIYLTIIYQFGIIGAFFYFMLPLSLLLSLFKTLQKHQLQRKLTKVLILSLFIFLINETKFEFTRKHEYISIIWTLFSIFYLHTKQFSKRENCLRDLKNASPYTHTL